MNTIKEQLLKEAHNGYLKVMLGDLPLEKTNEYVVDDVMGYGTAADEKIFGITDLLRLGKMQREQAEGLQVSFKVTPVFQRIGANEQTAIFVDEVFTTMLLDDEKHEIQMRTSTFFEFNNEAWKVTHLHVSTPVATENDAWHKEEWKRKNEELQKLVDEKTSALKKSLEELKSIQIQLIHSEKMASLGELTAGIAHEIQNPLNFINNFSELNTELVEDIQQEIDNENKDEAKTIASEIKRNEEKILYHGKRADAIVKNMLQHSRANTGEKEYTDVNALVEEAARLCYHGSRAKNSIVYTKIETQFDPTIQKINIVPQEITRVLVNLLSNALYSVTEKKKQLNGDFEPIVKVSTKHIMVVLK